MQAPPRPSLPEQAQVSEGSQTGAAVGGFFSATRQVIDESEFGSVYSTQCLAQHVPWHDPFYPPTLTLTPTLCVRPSRSPRVRSTTWRALNGAASGSQKLLTSSAHFSKTKFNEQNQPQKKCRPFFACCHFQVCRLTCQLLSTNGIDETLKIAVQYPVCVMHCDAISFASALTSSSSRNDIADY